MGDSDQVRIYGAGASPYGVMDMAGNVFEWVNDWYQTDYYSQSPASNPPGPLTGRYRVLRGGACDDGVGEMYTYKRMFSPPVGSSNGIGFRCTYPP